ncbi:hypothetical protein OO012_07770 [Rhodobacteraceae bacterium KMM 6894]|nr:hypothetical protein [Rhodobacteraceae bacterium KMM 6894]
MKNKWILDVLADLRQFARANDLSVLAEQLDDTCLIAASELASKTEGHATHDGRPTGVTGHQSEEVGNRH